MRIASSRAHVGIAAGEANSCSHVLCCWLVFLCSCWFDRCCLALLPDCTTAPQELWCLHPCFSMGAAHWHAHDCCRTAYMVSKEAASVCAPVLLFTHTSASTGENDCVHAACM